MSKRTRTATEAVTRRDKRGNSAGAQSREAKAPRFTEASDGWLVLDTASSEAASSSQAPAAITGTADKRPLQDKEDEDEMPEKSQKISSVCIGRGAADKIGEVSNDEEYDEESWDDELAYFFGFLDG